MLLSEVFNTEFHTERHQGTEYTHVSTNPRDSPLFTNDYPFGDTLSVREV